MKKPNIITSIRRNGGKPENASKLILWFVHLALNRREYLTPKVGDIVVETSHVISTAKLGVGLMSALGELIKIEPDADNFGPAYTILTVEGKKQRWGNAGLSVVYRNHP